MKKLLAFLPFISTIAFGQYPVTYDFTTDAGWTYYNDNGTGYGWTNAPFYVLGFQITTNTGSNFAHYDLPGTLTDDYGIVSKTRLVQNTGNFFPVFLTNIEPALPDNHPWKLNPSAPGTPGANQNGNVLAVSIRNGEPFITARISGIIQEYHISSAPVLTSNTDYWIKLKKTCGDKAYIGIFSNADLAPAHLVAEQSFTVGSVGSVTELYSANDNGQTATAIITGVIDDITIETYTRTYAGDDNTLSICDAAGIIDLYSLLSGSFTNGGTWAETTNPVSGGLSGSNFDTDAVPNGSTYTFQYISPVTQSCNDTASFSVNIGNINDFHLPNDTTICAGTPYTLTPGIFDSYLWDNASTQPTRTVSQAGTYWVKVGTVGGLATNVITNGDFEDPAPNFTTQYIPGTGGSFGLLSDPGTYAVTSNPNNVHSNFNSGQDHTPAPGTQMLVVNGSGTPNTQVWCQNSIPVTPDTYYQFGTWVTTVETGSLPLSQLQFSIGGANQGTVFQPATTSNTWTQFTTTWYSGVNTTTDICIVNQNTSTGGNDFAIDDISFVPVCYKQDTIVISTNPAPVITVTPNDTICSGEVGTLTASSNTPNLTYGWTWSGGGTQSGAVLSQSPSVTTVYSVQAVSPQGCPSNIVSNRAIVVYQTPVANIFINLNDTLCKGMQTTLQSIPLNNSNSFQWSSSSNTTQTEPIAPTVTTSYTLTVTSPAGCADDTTVTITVIPDFEVDITGNDSYCLGESTVLTASSSQSYPFTYTWQPGGSTANQITVNQPASGWIYLYDDYFGCPPGKDSLFITVSPKPVVVAPNDTTVCIGTPLTVSAYADYGTIAWSPISQTGTTVTITASVQQTIYVVAAQGNCISEPDSFVVMTYVCDIVVPNIFTPNGDKNNDFFQLVSYDGIASLKCTILNRWGNVINTFDKPDFQWDGKDQNGNEMETGVYFYVIEGQTTGTEAINRQGMVELFK